MALRGARFLILATLTYAAVNPLDPEVFQDFRLQQIIMETLDIPIPAVQNEEMAVLDGVLDSSLTPETDITFHLFTNDNPISAYLLKVGDSDNLKKSPFNPEWPTKIIIHGWTDSVNTFWFNSFRRNYLSVGDYNVIGVNWAPGAVKAYFISAKLTREVGEHLGELLEFLQYETNLSFADVHILGHSLGSHIAGFAGARLSGKVGRITGMDPARPAFEIPILKDPKDRLDATDAVFVDIIHSCSGTLGFIRPIGHADFYPNGGTFRQPGCSVIVSQYCSHGRSHQFMAESIVRPEGFIGTACDNYKDYTAGLCGSDAKTAVMGEKIDPDTRGSFYLKTNSESPFGN